MDKAGNGQPAKAELVAKAKSLGDKGDGKFTEFA